MTHFAWTTTGDFTGWSPYGHALFVAWAVVGITFKILMEVDKGDADMSYIVCSIIAITLINMIIVSDTQRVVLKFTGREHVYDIDDYALAATDLYMDTLYLLMAAM